MEDEDQTIITPPTEIRTTFHSTESPEEHETYVAKKLYLTDTVAYKGVAPGTTYEMTGTIMDKDTKKPLLDKKGKPYIITKSFVPETADGVVDLDFVLDAETVYGGKTLVAFEELTCAGELIAEHKQLDDEGQTVEVLPPEIQTTLLDDHTHAHVGNAFRKLSLTDTIRYAGLIPGNSYTMKGILMDTETKEPVLDSKGKKVTAEKTFVPEKSSGTLEMTFEFSNRELMGHELVAFEKLYEADVQIADHEDFEDEEQSVHFPFVRTTLTTNDTSKTFHPTKDLQLNDAVELNNLDLQTTYLIRGYLVDKNSGRFLRADGTGTKDQKDAMCSEIKFLATKQDALLNVEFALDASYIDFDLVCYEELYAVRQDKKGKETLTLVAEHSDIDDEAQSVHYKLPPKTGDSGRPLVWMGIFIAGLAGIILTGFVIRRKAKKR